MLATFFTAAITFLFSCGFVLAMAIMMMCGHDDDDKFVDGDDGDDDDLSNISRGGSLRSRHSPSRIQHFGKELNHNISLFVIFIL